VELCDLAALRRAQVFKRFQLNILIWDNPVLELPLRGHEVKWNVRLGKSIYDEEYRTLIDALKVARKAAGLTQQDLADKLGRPQSFLAKVEGYERRLDVVEFLHLCRAIGTEPATFFENI
jgi:DNA-binding XRE family transcriptional regulator